MTSGFGASTAGDTGDTSAVAAAFAALDLAVRLVLALGIKVKTTIRVRVSPGARYDK
jgi:hypothetical protein